MRLELFRADREKTIGMQGGEQPIGFRHLAFDADKLEPVLEGLVAEGITPDPIIDCDRLVPACASFSSAIPRATSSS